MSLGTYLLYLRAYKGASPREVARATGLPVNYVLALEWDRHSSRATRETLARYYGVRPWTLARLRHYSWGALAKLVREATAARAPAPVLLVLHNGATVTGFIVAGDASVIQVQQGKRLLLVQRHAVREWQVGDGTAQ